MNTLRRICANGYVLLAAGLLLVSVIYWPGLSGSWLFDDYPNIVDNKGVQPADASLPSLIRTALSSPSSEFKRPLASLSFALNYLTTGLDPYWMKLTNLGLHLFNGLLVFVLARKLLRLAEPAANDRRAAIVPALITAGWLLLPINLTAVLYTVQRMESMANLFVLMGLIGYINGRRRMLLPAQGNATSSWAGFALCVFSITVPTAVGLLAKETAALLPLYALMIEWLLLGFRSTSLHVVSADATQACQPDRRLVTLFALTLVIPMLAGSAWVLPSLLKPESWATRDFTLSTRLLSETRIVLDYICWTLLPTPQALSFYHDNFRISTNLVSPWTTIASIIGLTCLIIAAMWLRKRRPLVALGILLYLGCHLLTATVLPLELIYEHRNYFASFGLMLVIIPALVPNTFDRASSSAFPRSRCILAVGLILLWAGETALTAMEWGNPLHLAETLALRAPDSPRAQYELGRTYVIYSNYDPSSPFTRLASAALEKAARLPGSSILPEQALIFMNSRMHLSLKDAWWDSLNAKLGERKPGVQDESSLAALTQCVRDRKCDLPPARMTQSYMAALSHPEPSARLLAMYGDYAWNVLEDRKLGLRMAQAALRAKPSESAYHVTLIRMLAALGQYDDARREIEALRPLNIGGHLEATLKSLDALVPAHASTLSRAATQ